jgi:hypothetical protein
MIKFILHFLDLDTTMDNPTSRNKIIILLFLIASFSSCTVRLIAPYDEITDRQIFELQENVNLTFKKWQRDLPPIEDAQEFYDLAEVRLEILIERNLAIEKSDFIVQMLQKTLENITLIKEQHISGNLSGAFIKEVYPDINAQFNAIQRFLMALKRSEEKLR